MESDRNAGTGSASTDSGQNNFLNLSSNEQDMENKSSRKPKETNQRKIIRKMNPRCGKSRLSRNRPKNTTLLNRSVILDSASKITTPTCHENRITNYVKLDETNNVSKDSSQIDCNENGSTDLFRSTANTAKRLKFSDKELGNQNGSLPKSYPLQTCHATPQQPSTSKDVLPSVLSDVPIDANQKRGRRLRAYNNPFIDAETTISDDDASTVVDDDEEIDSDELDDDDRVFIASDDEDTTLTIEQHAMYLKSIRETAYKTLCNIRRGPPAKRSSSTTDKSSSSYEYDSFCDDGEVQYMEIGDFTQAMRDAKQKLMTQGDSGRQTRSKTRQMKESASSKVYKKKYKRILPLVDSSDEENET